MNHFLATLALRAQGVPCRRGDLDDDGYWTTTHWLIPERAELIYGGLASVIVIGLLIGRPARQPRRRSPPARNASKRSSTKRPKHRPAPRPRRPHAEALGDIEGERRRILAEADARADALLSDGRTRLQARSPS